MNFRDPRRRIATAAIIGFGVGALAIQWITNRPALGIAGLLLLAVPGFVISRAFGVRALDWPQILLATIGTSLVLAVLIGIVLAISPYGLNASSVAAIELLAAIAAVIPWLWYRSYGDRTPARLPIRFAPGSLLLVSLGLGLGGAGFVVATRAADDQDYARFVQFWSVPATTGADQLMGVRNSTGFSIDCEVAIDGPHQTTYNWRIGAIDNGQAWLGQLPLAEAPDAGRLDISLHCAASDGSTFNRRLSANPRT